MSLNFRLLPAVVLAAISLPAQQKFTAADYQRAEKMMSGNTAQLVLRAGVRPNWLDGDKFWYRVTTADGAEVVLVDPAKGTRAPAFDHAKLPAALAAASGRAVDARNFPQAMEIATDAKSIVVMSGKRFRCDIASNKCVAEEGAAPVTPTAFGPRGGGRAANEVLSPNSKKAAFIRDHNLWVRDVETKKETQMTTGGIKDFGYATDNAGWTKSDRPVLLWSPDSKRIATYQQDQRGVGEMYLVETKVGHPKLEAWKYPLPGDEVVTTIQRVVLDLDGPRTVRLNLPADQHRSSLCDDIKCRGSEWSDVQWAAESSELAFVSTSRDHKEEIFRIASSTTGQVREVLKESVSTFFESGNGRVNWHYLAATRELIWFSERDNWGHLYLYDTETSKLKHQITKGDWNVTQVLRVDEKNRELYFQGVGRESGRDPYFIHFYKVGFDGKGLTLLTPEDGNHEVTLAASGKYFTDSYSTTGVPPVTVLRDDRGKLIANLEKADISKLEATGWKPAQPFTVKARDGVTDLYGLLFKPTNFDPEKKYPIINHIYPGPQTGSVGSRSFSATRADTQSLAELGFIVVEIDGMGTPWRSKKFHEAYYGDMGDNTLPDQVSGMKQLAQRYRWIDIERAGIYGHSGGGYATSGAMFRYPDFFKVGVSQAGNHDNRLYEDDWGEKWQGLLTASADGKTNYDNQANQLQAKNLKGHLLLAHGTMDSNVPPVNTMVVVNELIKANKDFDLLLFPNRNHGFGNEPYMVRKRWDYFVRHLLGGVPPEGYEIKPAAGARGFGPPQ